MDIQIEEDMKRALNEPEKPGSNGKKEGMIGVIIGILGFFLPSLFAILDGIICAIFGVQANKYGQRKLGITCGVLSLLNLIGFLIFSISSISFI